MLRTLVIRSMESPVGPEGEWSREERSVHRRKSVSSVPSVLPAQQCQWRLSPLPTLVNRHFSGRKRATRRRKWSRAAIAPTPAAQPELPAHLANVLAAQQPQHHLGLPLRAPPLGQSLRPSAAARLVLLSRLGIARFRPETCLLIKKVRYRWSKNPRSTGRAYGGECEFLYGCCVCFD